MKLFKWIYKRFITRGDLLRVQTRFERACDATQREAALFWVRDTISFRNSITDSLKKGTHNDAVWSSRTNKAPPAMDTPISRTHTHLGGSPSRSRNLHANIACATPSQSLVVVGLVRHAGWQCLHWQSVSITGMTGAGSQINEPAAFVFAIDLTSGIRFWGESRSVYLRPD